MASVGLIGWLTVSAVSTSLERQAQVLSDNEAAALVDEFNAGGRADLEAALAGRFANSLVHTRYAVIEVDGRVSMGDPTLSPSGRRIAAAVGTSRIAVRSLGDGGQVVVADDLANVRAIESIVRRAFLIAFLTAAALGVGAGFFLAHALLHRLDAVTRTAEAVVGGDLGSRIARTGSGDEFDRLAAVLNRMLDRIGDLMDNLRQVSTDIAHDLRTPLSRLRQELEATDQGAATVPVYRAAVRSAIQDVDRILDIFAALLRIAQVEGVVRRAAFRPVDLAVLLRTIFDAYALPTADGGRTLEAVVDGSAWIDGDAELLTQLFSNLVENALQHTPPGSTVSLSLQRRTGGTMVEVCDDGPGIPASERDRVFRRFHRLERSRTSAGHGLGLSLVAAIVDLHGGKIALSDRGPGLRVSIDFTPPH